LFWKQRSESFFFVLINNKKYMKKQQVFIMLGIIFLGLIFGIYQYFQAFETENVSAVTVGVPNPGHTWAEIECSADTLCVDTVNKRVGIGTNNPTVALDVGGTTAIKMPVGTTAQRPTAADGMMRLNSTTGKIEYYNGGWNSLGGVSETTDIDGNIYGTVVIGTQTWMTSNLMTTRYNNGTAITRGQWLLCLST
jgi:hypothetical protein